MDGRVEAVSKPSLDNMGSILTTLFPDVQSHPEPILISESPGLAFLLLALHLGAHMRGIWNLGLRLRSIPLVW